jgi:SAM-dependent methyltransferase
MESMRKTIGQLSPDEIRKLVGDKYSEVAFQPTSKYKFAVGSQYALDLGYPAEEVHGLPGNVAESFTGVSSFLTRFDEFAPDSVILELGSGGGLDTALLTKRLDPAARIVGIDVSMAMLQRAARSLHQLDASHVHFNQSLAESLPIPDNSVDWVVSNGIFNLSPEKEKILLEIHRVLKPKGRVLCSEIVLYRDPSPEERQNEDDWFK